MAARTIDTSAHSPFFCTTHIEHHADASNCFLKVGDKVDAQWQTGHNWYGAVVIAVNDDGTFAVEYDDGEVWERVPRRKIIKGGVALGCPLACVPFFCTQYMGLF